MLLCIFIKIDVLAQVIPVTVPPTPLEINLLIELLFKANEVALLAVAAIVIPVIKPWPTIL